MASNVLPLPNDTIIVKPKTENYVSKITNIRQNCSSIKMGCLVCNRFNKFLNWHSNLIMAKQIKTQEEILISKMEIEKKKFEGKAVELGKLIIKLKTK